MEERDLICTKDGINCNGFSVNNPNTVVQICIILLILLYYITVF